MKIKNPEEQKADPIQEKAEKNDAIDVKARECTLSEDMQKLLIRQLCNEIYNHNVYRSFANYFGVRGFEKLEKYYIARAEEEKLHHDWCYYWLSYNDAEFKYPEIPAIDEEWETMEDPFILTLDLETNTTINIDEIIDQAFLEKDWGTWNWLMDHNEKTGALRAEQNEEMAISRTIRDIAGMHDSSWLKRQDLIYEAYFKE